MYAQAARAFEAALGDSQQLTVIPVSADQRESEARLQAVLQDPPRLVVAVGTRAAMAAKSKLRGVPILYCLALDPGRNHLVGPEVGGVTLNVALSQQFATIGKFLPGIRRIGVVYNEPTSGGMVRSAEELLKGPVRLIAREAGTPQEAARQIADLMDKVDAFWLIWDPVIANPANFARLVDLSIRNKVALIAPASPFVEAGAVMSVEPNYAVAGRRVAEMARQVLDGKKAPGAFAAEPPSDLTLTINGAVARKVGIPIPPDLTAEILSP
jgi:putative ABC transport system substrate-binding protein